MGKVKKKALITGSTGQDGSYLSELLLEKNYKIYGILRRTSLFNTTGIDDIRKLIGQRKIVRVVDCVR